MGKERIIFYSEHAKELQGSVGDKIEAIIAQGALAYDQQEKCFYCRPIRQLNGKPYNSTTYEIHRHPAYAWSCNCQGWRTKLRKHLQDPNAPAPGCSHIAALYESFARKVKFEHYDGSDYRQLTLMANPVMRE